MNSIEMSLCASYKNEFNLGVAMDFDKVHRYDCLVKKHFNSITPENEMKFEIIHPEPHFFCWENMDKLVEYARAGGSAVRGHTLFWHNQVPDWVKKLAGNSAKLKKVMDEHALTIVDRYKEVISSWDVVNEIFSDEKDIFRNTFWYETLGESFVERAFCLAREADPNGLLFLNEYNGHIPEKREKILDKVIYFRKKGIPIDGIGIQGHYNITYPPLDLIKKEIETYARLELKIQITELDISLFDFFDRRTDLLEPTDDMLCKQERLYESLFHLYEEYSEYISGVTLWGVADDYTWLDDYPVEGRKDWPLLFDENLRPKEVLLKIMRTHHGITN